MIQHPGSMWISKNYNTLPANEWVAADENGLVDHAPKYDELIKKLRSRKIESSNLVFAFIQKGIVQ